MMHQIQMIRAGRNFPTRYFAHYFALFAALFSLLIMAGLLLPQQVAAQQPVSVNLCNKTSYVIDVATALQAGAASQSKGWTQILSGDCAISPMKTTSDGQFYVYAQSVDAHAGAIQRFSGNEQFCIGARAGFEVDGRRECRERGLETADFAPADTRTKKRTNKPVVTFSDPLGFSQKRARIAGAQRLLSDIGYKVGQVDGYIGRRTRQSLNDFRKKNGLPPKIAITSDLLETLLQAVKIESDKRGLTLCNKTPDLIWAALSEVSKDSFKTQGWLKVKPDQCAKGINAVLNNRYYFIYAEAVDENANPVIRAGRRQLWSGDFNLCTKPTRFAIEGRNDCDAQGFDKTGFMKIDTGDKTSWVVDFE